MSYSYRMRKASLFMTVIALGGLALAGGCATTTSAPSGNSQATPKNATDADAHLVIAEIALQRGDSLGAATEYLAASHASP
ncbi:MAG TPA: hypothetical protein VEZ88_00240, partial [Steroidobacteraceae bacterium]|nr:hypothetical protein [Steroidobacteraceae bacterium]